MVMALWAGTGGSLEAGCGSQVWRLMSFRNDTLHWELTFSRNIQDWELDTMNSFMELIYSTNLDGNGVDTLCWQQKSKGRFTVRSFYRCLSPTPSLVFPWKGVWNPKVPPRVAFFLWTTVLGKILTADNLRKRKIVIVTWCCMCKDDGESIGHLFIHCPVVKELWDAVLSLFGVMWVMPRRVRNLIEGWHGSNHHQSIIWNAVPHCLMWSVWRERNSRIFEDSETTIDDLKLRFFRSLFEWMQATNLFSFVSFQDFLDSCNS
jgi:hypothetical protein